MCGIVGIWSQTSAVTEIYDSLIHLQHRGQNAAGMITIDDKLHVKLGQGLVSDVFSQQDIEQLTGNLGLGHVRYPTSGNATSSNETQPFWISNPYGMAIVHNGNLTNYDELKQMIKTKYRRHLNTNSDSEILLHLLSIYLEEEVDTIDSFLDRLYYAINKIHTVVSGSYSVVCAITHIGLIGFRDPYGIRPLLLGKNNNDANNNCKYIIASEDTPFFSLDYELIDNIQPGEVVFIDEQGELHRKRLTQHKFKPCVFEHIYFARPDAILDDVSVYEFRRKLGQLLAKAWQAKYPDVSPDVVIPIPFTSTTAAIEFALLMQVPYREGIYKNQFIGRTFIMADQCTRSKSVKYKLSPHIVDIKDKDVLLIDDSIVRGTTSKEIISMVKKCGAKKVYLLSTAPPIKYPCYYGINTPTQDELIANKLSIDELRKFLDVDILLFQSTSDLMFGMADISKRPAENICIACMDGNYIAGKINCKTKDNKEKNNVWLTRHVNTDKDAYERA